jgi:hypothetical protein
MVEEHTGGKVLPLPGADQQKTAWHPQFLSQFIALSAEPNINLLN